MIHLKVYTLLSALFIIYAQFGCLSLERSRPKLRLGDALSVAHAFQAMRSENGSWVLDAESALRRANDASPPCTLHDESFIVEAVALTPTDSLSVNFRFGKRSFGRGIMVVPAEGEPRLRTTDSVHFLIPDDCLTGLGDGAELETVTLTDEEIRAIKDRLDH